MTPKLHTKDDFGGTHYVYRDRLKAEHPEDLAPLKKHLPERMPRNPNTHISIRLPQDMCDWIWEQYPNEPTISSAVHHYLKDMYVSGSKAGSVR